MNIELAVSQGNPSCTHGELLSVRSSAQTEAGQGLSDGRLSGRSGLPPGSEGGAVSLRAPFSPPLVFPPSLSFFLPPQLHQQCQICRNTKTSRSVDGYDGDVIEPATYPPAPGTGLSSGLRRVTFTYNPLYPHPGSLQHVVGILSPTDSEAIDALAEFFPSLANIDPTRLSLTLPNAAQSESGSDQKNKPWVWAVLTSGVWPSVVADPPERLGVVLEDLPEEEAKRARRDRLILATVVGVVLSPAWLGGLFAWAVSRTKSAP